MTTPLKLYLLDMDSVLLHPGGYRAALVATVNHFSQAVGVGKVAPTLEEIEAFESVGISSEWDITPICIAALSPNGARPDYHAIAERVAGEIRPGEYPAEAAYRVLPRPPFTGWGVRTDEILLHSRDIHRSPVLSLFQQYALGEAFETTYGLPRIIESEATLSKYDSPQLTVYAPQNSVIYTTRPCKPPRDVTPLPGYAPEAELGAELVELSYLPLIGYGSLHWLAETVGGNADAYLKPSPVHAWAAIAAAAQFPESESLRAAEALSRGEWQSPLADLRERGGIVTVFEDSASSIQSVREAVKALGEAWACVGVGVAEGGPKYDALKKVADRIYPSIDSAIRGEVNG
ncbi:MAG: hypothetical protein HYZ49_03610 [Chloroflexi bacterium]|nr:hypothetical protein [Chloroflexota bacterium]